MPFVFVLMAFVVGCAAESPKTDHQARQPDDPKVEKWESSSDFFMGNTNFGIQTDTSSFEVAKGSDGRLFLSVAIHGNDKAREKIREDEKSEWAWTLGSPYFTLDKFPISEMPKDTGLTIKLNPADSDKHGGMYAREHFGVTDVSVKVSEQQIEIFGRTNIGSCPISIARLRPFL